MRLPALLAALALTAGLAACDDGRARPSARDVDARVADAEARLSASEPGRAVLASIEAHGGLGAWYGSGPLAMRYAYTRLDSLGQPDTSRAPLTTDQLVDAWRARAVHTVVADTSQRFGWTGTEAWATSDELPIDARFWSLTPYYFIGMPFVLADPGVRLEAADTLTVEGAVAEQVRVTFDPGTGDAPDDYYFLLVDPETRRVRGVRYVVSYGPFNPDGGHTPETIMLYDGAQAVGGPAGEVVLQGGFRSFAWDGDARGPGAPKARGELTDVSFAPETPDAAFDAPAGVGPLPDPGA